METKFDLDLYSDLLIDDNGNVIIIIKYEDCYYYNECHHKLLIKKDLFSKIVRLYNKIYNNESISN